MKVLSEKKLSSGDYELDCEFTDYEVQFLINYAVNAILKKQVKELKKKKKEKK